MSPNSKPAWVKYCAQLRQKIDEHFDDDELRTLCFDLGLDYNNLLAVGKAGKVRELVSHCDRYGRIRELVEKCAHQFPQVDWGNFSVATPLVDLPLLTGRQVIGRDEILANLRAHLISGKAVALRAVKGLPGVGKTMLAAALAHDEQVKVSSQKVGG